MSSSRTSSCSCRLKMLKDFLIEDSNSCSSSGFKSCPRRIYLHSARKASKGLQRTRSKAASMTISAFQALINSIKSIQFTAVKSPSILPRSLSRRLSKKNIHRTQNYNTSTTSHEGKVITTVKIKDIIRWKSFCDLVEEESQSQPSNHHHLTSSPDHHTTTSCSSNASSWCDSDFTSDYLPSCSGNYDECNENDVELGKKNLPCVGRYSLKATTESPTVGPKDDLACDQKEHSPISVLEYDDRFEEDSLLSLDRTLINLERSKRKVTQNIRRFESLAEIESINLDEWMSMENSDDYEEDESDYDEEEEEEEEDEVEEKAKLLMSHVNATSCLKNSEDTILVQMLLDFFVEELSTKRNQIRNVEADIDQMIWLAKTWINGEQRGAVGLEECVREMDRKDGWSKFEEEQGEIGLQIENGLLNHLLDELLADLFLC